MKSQSLIVVLSLFPLVSLSPWSLIFFFAPLRLCVLLQKCKKKGDVEMRRYGDESEILTDVLLSPLSPPISPIPLALDFFFASLRSLLERQSDKL